MSEPAGSGPEVVRGPNPEPEVLIDLGQAPPEPTPRPRRLTAGVASALAIAVVAAVAVGGAQFLNRGSNSATIAPRASATEPTPEDGLALAGIPSLAPMQATFTDAEHGYLVMLRCPAGKVEECTSDLSVTDDGGHSWSRRGLPGAALATTIGMGGLFVFDDGGLVFDQPEGYVSTGSEAMPMPSPGPDGEMSFDVTTMPGYRPARRWVSRNGGQTWHEVSRTAKGTVSEAAVDSLLFFPEHNLFAPMAIDPSTDPSVVFEQLNPPAEVLRPDGTSARLKNAPKGGSFSSHAVVHARDGSIWVVGFSPSGPVAPPTGSGEFEFPGTVIRVSRDRGRTWHAVTAPDGMAAGQFFTADGRALCFLNYKWPEQAQALVFSHDSGARWTTLAVTKSGSTVDDIGYSVAPLSTGAFLVADGHTVRRLDPGANSLVEVAGAPDIIGLVPAGRWVMGLGKDMATLFGSPDGVSWIELNLA